MSLVESNSQLGGYLATKGCSLVLVTMPCMKPKRESNLLKGILVRTWTNRRFRLRQSSPW